jgi:flagellar L-ring protein precursor FlgH
MNRTVPALLAALLGAGCVNHIAPYRPKTRHFDEGDYEAPVRASGSSLYSEDGPGLFEDDRAARVGDVLLVRIDEADSATRDDSTNLDRAHSSSYATPASLGLLAALQGSHPGVDPAKLFGVENESTFAGSGRVQRRGRVTATLPVRVRRRLPNGDLFVEGHKVVLVGHEEQHIYVSGVVRRADVLPDNSVLSSRIAEAEIEMTGRGDVSDQQRPGWLSRLVAKVWPF